MWWNWHLTCVSVALYFSCLPEIVFSFLGMIPELAYLLSLPITVTDCSLSVFLCPGYISEQGPLQPVYSPLRVFQVPFASKTKKTGRKEEKQQNCGLSEAARGNEMDLGSTFLRSQHFCGPDFSHLLSPYLTHSNFSILFIVSLLRLVFEMNMRNQTQTPICMSQILGFKK